MPTKSVVTAASFSALQGAVLVFVLFMTNAEDVKQKQLEEKAEERETFSMGQKSLRRLRWK